MNDCLPIIELTSQFVKSLSALLQNEIRRFTKEEGGYLTGQHLGHKITINGLHHDLAADASAGDIHFSTEAFDEASKLAGAKDDTVMGTWHLHPPGWGARPSSTDIDSLFVDRMVLNALDLNKYDAPWIHIIVPGLDMYRLQAYMLDVLSDAKLEFVSRESSELGILDLPEDRQFGLVLKSKQSGEHKFHTISQRLFSAALRADRLEGIWRLCKVDLPCLRWERVFLENFARKVKSNRFGGIAHKKGVYAYWRIYNPSGTTTAVVERYTFTLPRKLERELFVSAPVSFPEKRCQVLLQNPDTDDASYEVFISPQDRVSTLINLVKEKAHLSTAPILWTLLDADAADCFREKTRVEGVGKVFLPEDATIGTIMSQRVTPEVPIYWETPELSSETVRKLRTDRYARMGYDLSRLRTAHVLIAGLGLLGAGIARLLGALSVGKITLVDKGFVDWVDLYRQELYEHKDVGFPKANVAASRLTEMGCMCQPLQLEIPSVLIPDVEAAARSLESLSECVQPVDVVVGSLDSFSCRAVLQIICRLHGVPFLAASLDYIPSLNLTQGSIALFNGKSGQCYGCGSGLKMQKDQGACTKAPIEFPGIVNSLASKLLVDALQTNKEIAFRSCRIYKDYRIEMTPIGPAVNNCRVCSLSKQARELPTTEWVQNVISWLIS